MKRKGDMKWFMAMIIAGVLCSFCSNKSQVDREIVTKTEKVKNDLTQLKLSVGNTIHSASYTIPADPFAANGSSFRYYYFEQQKAYILSSDGPDQDDDLKNILDAETMKSNKDLYALVRPKTYDASNGVLSDGDIIVVGP